MRCGRGAPQPSQGGLNALHLACKGGCESVVRLLLDRRFDIAAVDNVRWSAPPSA